MIEKFYASQFTAIAVCRKCGNLQRSIVYGCPVCELKKDFEILSEKMKDITQCPDCTQPNQEEQGNE